MSEPDLHIQDNSCSFCNTSTLVLILILSIGLTSCAPQSKESYMNDYEEFLTEISEQSQSFTDSDWSEVDKKYEQFTGEWQDKFNDEYTFQEELILSKNDIQYNLLRAKVEAKKLFENVLEVDYDELKLKVRQYAEKDMTNDISNLLLEAKQTGDSALQMMEQILIELEIDLNEINQEQ